jgi:hypothetical protein
MADASTGWLHNTVYDGHSMRFDMAIQRIVTEPYHNARYQVHFSWDHSHASMSLAASLESFVCHFCPYGISWMSNMIFLCKLACGIPQLPYQFRIPTSIKKTCPSGRIGCIRLDALRQSCHSHPGGGIVCPGRQDYVSRGISPSDRYFPISFHSVSHLYQTKSLGLGPNVTKHRNGFIGYTFASGLQGVTLPNLSSGYFYIQLRERRKDPCNCIHPPSLGKSEWDEKLGKIECVWSLYDKMRLKWDGVYLPQSLPNIYFAWLIPPPLPLYRHAPTVPSELSTSTRWSNLYGAALAGQYRVNWEIHSETVINQVWRYTGRRRLRVIGGALGGWNRVNSEMHFEATIEWVWTNTSRPRSSESRDAHWGCDQASLEINLQAMIKRDWRSTWRWSMWREARW